VQPSESEPEGDGAAARFCRFVDRLSGWCGALAGLAVLGILALVCVEILMRNLFGRSTLISDEIAGYLNAAAVFLALGYTMREGAFIRVDTVYAKLRGRALLAARWVFTILTIVSVVVLLAYVLIQESYLFRNNVRSDSLTQTLLYIPESVVIVGLAVLLLQLVTYLVKRVRDVP
jgi:TRAP-type mannitol/chloroaromatic compound transport system permease small subunit